MFCYLHVLYSVFALTWPLLSYANRTAFKSVSSVKQPWSALQHYIMSVNTKFMRFVLVSLIVLWLMISVVVALRGHWIGFPKVCIFHAAGFFTTSFVKTLSANILRCHTTALLWHCKWLSCHCVNRSMEPQVILALWQSLRKARTANWWLYMPSCPAHEHTSFTISSLQF